MTHDQEPWELMQWSSVVADTEADGIDDRPDAIDIVCPETPGSSVRIVIATVRSNPNVLENAKRIVACVNYCAGMSNEALEIDDE